VFYKTNKYFHQLVNINIYIKMHGSTIKNILIIFFTWFDSLPGPKPSQCWGFKTILKHTHTIGITPLDEWSARSRHLYMTTHNIHNHASAGFEHIIPERNPRLRPHGHWGKYFNHVSSAFKITGWKGATWENAQSLSKTRACVRQGLEILSTMKGNAER
jgi:hypothetical protein